jgi:hypothetical protein
MHRLKLVIYHRILFFNKLTTTVSIAAAAVLSGCEQAYDIVQVAHTTQTTVIDNNNNGGISNNYVDNNGNGIDDNLEKLPGYDVDPNHDSNVELAPGLTASADKFAVNVTKRKIDVLFMMDNSGSMAAEQTSVSQAFNHFIDGFVSQNLDYHIGVVSSDASTDAANWTGGAYSNFPNEGAGSLLARSGNSRYISSSSGTAAVVSAFTQNINLGTSGNGAETGLLSLMAALDPAKLAGWNSGFLRDDALLAMIVVSDEDESVSSSDNNYLKGNPQAQSDRISSFVTQVKGLKPARPDLIRFDAVVAPSQAECPSVTSTNGVVGTGDTYMAVAKQLAQDGQEHVMNVCSDFSSKLVSLGNTLSIQIERRFQLTYVPRYGSIVVKLNGIMINSSATNGWIYDMSHNEIVLNGLGLEQMTSFDLRVNYVRK